ncbi:MAG: beta-ketoacyl synthase chain length factor [Fibrobacter sp.]|nr:beta-ketoacyl synthase chain length factor [Fibrobacter sp.]
MIYIEKFKVFVPSEEAPQPDVKFVPMLTRRRLSLLSKMVVFVNDAVSKDLPPCKVTFASQYGEISQQLKISDTLLQTGNVSPAHFSLSVFNASIANATILEKNTAGYSAVFSGKDAFRHGLTDCAAALESGSEKERIFVFADEKIPETYAPVAGVSYPNAYCALALRLSVEKTEGSIELDPSPLAGNFETAADEALEFIRTRLPA